nr:hypothetical protein GCM10020093_010680 [Planobispora longispora]
MLRTPAEQQLHLGDRDRPELPGDPLGHLGVQSREPGQRQRREGWLSRSSRSRNSTRTRAGPASRSSGAPAGQRASAPVAMHGFTVFRLAATSTITSNSSVHVSGVNSDCSLPACSITAVWNFTMYWLR